MSSDITNFKAVTFNFLLKGATTTLVACSFIGCGRGANYRSEKPNVELIQDMMAGPQLKAQEWDAETGKASVKTPPQGSISRERYTPEDLKLEEAEKLQNPLASTNLAAELSLKYEDLGQQKYEINCAICHGLKGDGLGALVEKRGNLLLKKPPSLLSDSYKNYSDGRMYYVITYGWGLMGNYGTQITDENERWAVVNYIRQLQKLAPNTAKNGDQ